MTADPTPVLLHPLRAHRRTTRRPVAVLTLVIALAAALVPCGATASPGTVVSTRSHAVTAPGIRLVIPRAEVDAGEAFVVRIRSHRLPRATFVLQRRTEHGTFRKVSRVGRRGSFEVPGVGIGRHVFRVVARRHGRVLATSPRRQLRSYGDVALTDFCGPTAPVFVCEDGSVPVGSLVFTHAAYAFYGNIGPDGTPNAEITASTCRSVTVSFAVSNAGADDGATGAGVVLTQERSAAQTATAPAREVGVASFAIASPSWDLTLWTAGSQEVVYWNAVMSCFTASGLR